MMNELKRANRVRKTRTPALVLATLALLTATHLGASGVSIHVIQPTTSDADLQPFVGTWHAQFKGKTFLTINLEKQQGKLTGTVSHTEIEVDKDGELTSAEEQEGSNPIVEARLASGTLHITIKEETSQDTIQWDMKLTGADQAELRLVAPPDVPAPKPWKLERAKGGQ